MSDFKKQNECQKEKQAHKVKGHIADKTALKRQKAILSFKSMKVEDYTKPKQGAIAGINLKPVYSAILTNLQCEVTEPESIILIKGGPNQHIKFEQYLQS